MSEAGCAPYDRCNVLIDALKRAPRLRKDVRRLNQFA